jgi:hypothetical protein
MAINNPTIAANTASRGKVQRTVVKLTSTRPPGERRFMQDGQLLTESQDPEREGQMLVYYDFSTGENRLYIVATVDTVLTWVPVATSISYRDGRTGREWDPLAPLYNYLAS